MKWRLLSIPIFLIMLISMIGCSTTIVLQDEYDVRIINRTGDTVKIRWDDGTYRRIEDDGIIIISSVDFGYHELTWEQSSGSRKTYSEVYEIKIDADFEIVLKNDSDDSDNSVIVIEY